VAELVTVVEARAWDMWVEALREEEEV